MTEVSRTLASEQIIHAGPQLDAAAPQSKCRQVLGSAASDPDQGGAAAFGNSHRLEQLTFNGRNSSVLAAELDRTEPRNLNGAVWSELCLKRRAAQVRLDLTKASAKREEGSSPDRQANVGRIATDEFSRGRDVSRTRSCVG